MKKTKLQSGSILVQAFVFGTISIVIIGALISWAGVNIKASRVAIYREQALQIAEAGIDYYRWHLAHNQTDYQDGTATSGPYIHDFLDKDGTKVGTFTLDITPPPTGFTLVKIKSTGKVLADPTVSRSILVQLAIPSLAKYAVVANDEMRFGEGTEVYGPIHSNGGIRFDGIAHNLITSGKNKYQDPDHSGGQEFGVHTHVNTPPSSGVNEAWRPLEAPNNPVQNRTDVFQAGRVFPVPLVDFVGLTTNLAQMKSLAQSNGKYISSSGAQGYHIILKTNDTFDLYKVTQLATAPGSCKNDQGQDKWGTWSIKSNGQTFVANYPFPQNGIIFVEDNLWIDGQINGARLTIAVGRFPDNPSQRTSITINDNLLYTNYDGSDTIGLIAQENINVGLNSADTMRIDAALIAQNGRSGRYYYSSSCGSSYVRNTLTLYGMLGSFSRYGFAYTDGTGYDTRNITYDANLLYGPPPSFPLTSDQYQTISWQEVN
ncbi:MAG: hypothetical protein WCK48_02205 [bacterium]